MADPQAAQIGSSALDQAVLRGRAQAAIAAGFALLLLACAAALILSNRTREADAWVTHTLDVRGNLARLSTLLTEAESAQRGFLLTGETPYLEPLNRARAAMPEVQAALVKLTNDNPQQQARVSALQPVVTERMALIERSVALRTAGKREAATAIVQTGDGLSLMTRARALIADADAQEAELFAARTRVAGAERTSLVFAMIGSAAVATVLMLLVGLLGRRYTRLLVATNTALKSEMAERERAEGHLRQVQKIEAIGRLTGGIAHDFNNILAIVIGSLDMALGRMDANTRYRKLVENALDGAKRGATLTQRLLAFSRLQPLDPKPTDINRSVSQMSELLVRTLGESVRIETVVAAGLWPSFVDSGQLESAILNLAVNARDAMPNGGRLTLETANTYLDQAYADSHDDVEPGQYVMVAVTDTGTGMSPSVMQNAFDPFFTTKGPGAGTGLGLSQVHGFVKQSGGHLKLYSEPGHGTTVKLYLPRVQGEVAAPEQSRAAPVKGGKLNIMVVEDEGGVRAFVVDALQELGHAVIEAPGGAEALDLLPAHQDIDLLLTDIIMPGLNGRQLADKVKEQRPDLPVLYMTGYTRNAIVHNGMLDPGTSLLTKPFTLAQLETEIRACLAGK